MASQSSRRIWLSSLHAILMAWAAFLTPPSRITAHDERAMLTPHVHQVRALSLYGTLSACDTDELPSEPQAPAPYHHQGPALAPQVAAARRAAARLSAHHLPAAT